MAASLNMKVSEHVLQEWDMNGAKLQPSVTDCRISEGVMAAVYSATGLEDVSVAHDVAYIQVEEWESMAMTTTVGEVPINLVMRSKLRQLYAACRLAATWQDTEGGQERRYRR